TLPRWSRLRPGRRASSRVVAIVSGRSRRAGIVAMPASRCPRAGRIARMKRWYGKLLGFIAGWLLMRHPAGGLIGLLIGHAFDSDWFRRPADGSYAVLGLGPDASDADVDRAYRRLIAQYHPDRLGGAAEEL